MCVQREIALQALLESSKSDSEDLVLLLPRYLPSLIADFPHHAQTALDAAYDVVEHDQAAVRVQGYKLVVELATVGLDEHVGTMTDVLMQMLNSSHAENSTEEISTLEECIQSLVNLDPGASVGLLTTLLKKGSSCTIPASIVWNLLQGPLEQDIQRWWKRPQPCLEDNDDDDSRSDSKTTIDNLYALLTQTRDLETSLKAADLLLASDQVRGPLATNRSMTQLLAAIIDCALARTDPSIIQTYLEKIDVLLDCVKPGKVEPDYRWLLYLYCHQPGLVNDWTRRHDLQRQNQAASTSAAPSPPGPWRPNTLSRLLQWTIRSWQTWKHEIMTGTETDQERLTLQRLAVNVIQKTIGGLPRVFPYVISSSTIPPVLPELEYRLVIAYYLFTKLRARVNYLMGPSIRKTMHQVWHVCERTLNGETVDIRNMDPVERAQWINVEIMTKVITESRIRKRGTQNRQVELTETRMCPLRISCLRRESALHSSSLHGRRQPRNLSVIKAHVVCPTSKVPNVNVTTTTTLCPHQIVDHRLWYLHHHLQ